MTDEQIIKALECCVGGGKCKEIGCPFRDSCMEDLDALQKHSLDLINRQKEEIERLKTMNSELRIGLKVIKRTEIKKALLYDRDQYDKGYQDGIEEFAEKLLELCTQEGAYEYVSAYDIDILKREMVGE